MKYLFTIAITSLLFGCKSSQSPIQSDLKSPGAESIVTYLASDELGGRDSGTEGINMAAQYIESYFEMNDVKPFFLTYRDSFRIKSLDAYNVVGFVEGTDPELKNEFVLFGAHYDHVGLRAKAVDGDSIANGANDNATGTAAVMMLAKHFAMNPSNRRSLIFALFSGEEMGLVGSRHLSAKLKEDNLDLYAMINFEMIGIPFKDRDYEAFVSGYDLSNMAEKINEYVGTNLIGRSDVAVKYNLFKRSDNYPFYLDFKVPCQTISSCDLTNFDFYHHVDDEADIQDYAHLTNLVEELIPAFERVANSENKEIQMNDE